jgi:hypothetical protein
VFLGCAYGRAYKSTYGSTGDTACVSAGGEACGSAGSVAYGMVYGGDGSDSVKSGSFLIKKSYVGWASRFFTSWLM